MNNTKRNIKLTQYEYDELLKLLNERDELVRRDELPRRIAANLNDFTRAICMTLRGA